MDRNNNRVYNKIRIVLKRISTMRFLFFLILVSPLTHGNIYAEDRSGKFDSSYEPLIDSIINLLSLQEKIDLLHGNGMFLSAGIERLGLPELKYTDGPTGVREEMERDTWKPLHLVTDSVTFFPTGTALAATWNKQLALQMGIAIGSEANARGKHILLGPGVNIIRTPLCGRNFEYFTEDPCLDIAISNGYIKGVQMQDVAACIKHYALNNQESRRWDINTLVDERTLREIYLPVYKAAVYDADVFTFMGSYNKFRGNWLCENDYLLNKVLKDEWGFKGVVMSDWGATHSTVKAALSGLDIEMGTRETYDKYFFSNALYDSVKTGIIPLNIIDDKVRRVLRVMLNCKINDPKRITRAANTPEICSTAYNIASEAIVLLKNSDKILPLDLNKIKSIAIIGENATHHHASGGFGAGVKTRYEITPLQGIKAKTGDRIALNIAEGYTSRFIRPKEDSLFKFQKFPDSIPDMALIEKAVEAAKKSDIAIIFAGSNHGVETEAFDRRNIKLPFGQEQLIEAVTKANPRTIVVIVAGSAFDLSYTNKMASAILYSWFNGSEGGHALADVLFGDVNPSGKLPFTIPVRLEDIPAHALNAYSPTQEEVEYKEAILVGYRWFDTKNMDPLFSFGYGLSYSTFQLSEIRTDKEKYSSGDSVIVYCNINNTSKFPGKETVQLYVNDVECNVLKPAKELKAFEKVFVPVGQQPNISLKFKVTDLAYYDIQTSRWIVEPGTYKIMIGTSSRDIKLEKSILIE
jgi:beta-glucosidase